MSKIVVRSACDVDGIRLSLRDRIEHNLSLEDMRDNHFVEMYGLNRLGNDRGSKLFLGIIHQLTCVKRSSETGSTIIVEQPEEGLSHAQKRIVMLSILHLAHTGRDVILETSDSDFVGLVKLLQSVKRNSEGAEALMNILGVDRYQRIWSQIFKDVLQNLHTDVVYNPTDDAKEVVL